MQTRNDRCAPCYGRRAVLGPVLGLALAPLLVGVARAEDEPEKTDAARLPPQPGDRLVFLTGPNKGQVVRLDNLAMGGPQVQVFPAGPDGTVRNGTPLNLVILARFDPAELSDETRERAAEGVVAYSAVCTHQACPVNMWSKARDGFVCSRFALTRLHAARTIKDWEGSSSADGRHVCAGVNFGQRCHGSRRNRRVHAYCGIRAHRERRR